MPDPTPPTPRPLSRRDVAKLYALTALLFVVVVGAIATSIVVGRMIDA